MDWSTIVVVALLAAGCIAALYQSQREGWGVNQKAGTAIFLVGGLIGLVLDDFLSPESALLPWTEPIGAAIILIGLYFYSFRES